jgi:hypothetical protein
MSTEAISALSAQLMSMTPGANVGAQPAQANAVDVAKFQSELQQVQQQEKAQQVQNANLAANAPPAPSQGMKWIAEGLSGLGGRAQGLAVEAQSTSANGETMKPKDMLMLSVHAHEFLFHCELTSNVANRTSDGIQQLFRQQS